jgi:hypothetical protein
MNINEQILNGHPVVNTIQRSWIKILSPLPDLHDRYSAEIGVFSDDYAYTVKVLHFEIDADYKRLATEKELNYINFVRKKMVMNTNFI